MEVFRASSSRVALRVVGGPHVRQGTRAPSTPALDSPVPSWLVKPIFLTKSWIHHWVGQTIVSLPAGPKEHRNKKE